MYQFRAMGLFWGIDDAFECSAVIFLTPGPWLSIYGLSIAQKVNVRCIKVFRCAPGVGTRYLASHPALAFSLVKVEVKWGQVSACSSHLHTQPFRRGAGSAAPLSLLSESRPGCHTWHKGDSVILLDKKSAQLKSRHSDFSSW